VETVQKNQGDYLPNGQHIMEEGRLIKGNNVFDLDQLAQMSEP
jgi:hypothetical protein